MPFRFSLLVGFLLLGGCNLSIPNGLFGCGQPTDCPSGYFCWSSDSRCYDTKEPECDPRSCEEVIADFASLGIAIECGSLPDGCEGSIECGSCPLGEACGANGQNFTCGCEENTCAGFGEGAECGFIPARCGGDEERFFCGACLGDQVCVDNRCVCPPGANCGQGCGDACGDNEVCVGGECCEPRYPCSENECSPPGGLPDGCGGLTQCNSCSNGENCVLSDDLVFECLGDCTCEAGDVECGNAVICGSPTLCGTCEDNGFGEGYRCDGGRCTCKDPFERNDSFDDATLICGLGAATNCMQDAWGVEVQATLHHPEDVDVYALQVLDVETPIVAQIVEGFSDRLLYLTYICPDGEPGLVDCSGWDEAIQGVDLCIAEGEAIAIERKCDPDSIGGPEGDIGTVLVAVASNGTQTQCDPYHLNVFASYQAETPFGL